MTTLWGFIMFVSTLMFYIINVLGYKNQHSFKSLNVNGGSLRESSSIFFLFYTPFSVGSTLNFSSF